MRRSICYCEPGIALAGEVKTWKFIYTTSVNLPKGAKLKFNLGSEGRIIDWEMPDSNPKATHNVIYALAGEKVIFPKEISHKEPLVPEYEFTLPISLKAGDDVTIVMGAPKGKEKSKGETGTMAQIFAQRRRPFYLYIDPKGSGKYEEPEVFTLDIKGNKLKNIKVLAPSFVTKNKRFDVLVRFEDEFGNLTNNAPDDTLIELTYEHLRENLNWKLFLPETGFISLPNLYFNETGVYSIALKNLKSKEVYHSSPIRCFSEQKGFLYWGLFHGESDRYDATENIESCLRHFRDDQGFNFFASSVFEMEEESSNEIWKLITHNLAEFNEEDRFTTFVGFQWCGGQKTEGVRQLIYAKDNKPILKSKDAKYNTLKKIYKSFAPKEIISIPTFTMGKGYEFNFEDFHPEYERVVEIYNSWGSSECTEKEGNPFPIRSQKKNGITEAPEGSIRKALNKNCRFGFVAGGLDDRGIFETLYEKGQEQYPPGLTGIVAKQHNREALFEALYNRCCFATSGQRMLVGMEIIGFPMGQELNSGEKPGLLVNRHITGYIAGTTNLHLVELICNGAVLKTFDLSGTHLEFIFDDTRPLEKIAIDNKDKRPPFVYYYLRAVQEDGHVAWGSPIWIDVLPPKPFKPESRRAAQPVKKPLLNFEEEEFSEDIDDLDDLDVE